MDASQWVVVDPSEELEKEFVVLDLAKKTSSSSSSSSTTPSAFSTVMADKTTIRLTDQTRSFLRSSRETLRKDEEEETTPGKGKENEEETTTVQRIDESLQDEDVNEELVEMEEAYNVKEAEEAEERRLLDVLRTSGEVSNDHDAYTEEQLLMEVIASENFGMVYNPFNDPLDRLRDDEALAIALTAQEIELSATPNYNRRGIQDEIEIQRQHQRRLEQQREIQSRIAEEMKLEFEKQAELSRVLALLSEVDAKDSKGNVKGDSKPETVVQDSPTILTWGKDTAHGCLGRSATKSEVHSARTPVGLPPQTRFIQVGAGKAHTIALSETGDVWAWGSNTRGQLGNGETGKPYLKPQLSLLSGINIRQIACGALHTICVTDTGKVVAFGDNSCGQLGVSVSIGAVRASPVVVKGIEAITVESCAAGDYHSALVTATRNLYTFGSDSDGQLGLGSVTTASDKPCLVLALHNQVCYVACGGAHTVAITTDNSVYCWGKRCTKAPSKVEALEQDRIRDKVVKVACGSEHTLALTAKGLIFAWGAGNYGQTGTGSFSKEVSKPTVLSSLYGVVIQDITCGENVSMAISESGDLYSWGLGRNLQLGKGTDNQGNEAHPSVSQQLSNRCIRQASCGSTHCAAIVEGMSLLSSAMSSIFNNKEAQADIVLVCENKRIYAHRAILSLRSLYFRAFLQKAHTDQSPGLIAINISNVAYLPLFYLIKFLYTESVGFPDTLLDDVVAVAKKMVVPQFEERIKKNRNVNQERLSVELCYLINVPDFSDVIFVFEEDPSKKLFAHKAIISARSTYFTNMFRWQTKTHEISATKQDTTKKDVISVSCSFDALYSVLQFIYGGKVNQVNGDNVVELFVLSHQYNLFGLKASCEEFLIDGLDLENVLSLLRLASLHDSANLKNACISFAASLKNFEQLTGTEEGKESKNKSLVEDWEDLVKNDRALSVLIEAANRKLQPKVRKDVNTASWSYWDEKMREEDAKFFEEDEEYDDEEEDDDDEDDDDLPTSSKKKPSRPATTTAIVSSASSILRNIRSGNRMTIDEIAGELKIKANDWRAYESGKAIPPKAFWVKLNSYAIKSGWESPELKMFVGK